MMIIVKKKITHCCFSAIGSAKLRGEILPPFSGMWKKAINISTSVLSISVTAKPRNDLNGYHWGNK